MFKKKLFRTLLVYKVQFFAVFFMMLIGVSVFVGLNSAWYGLQSYADEYYEKTNLADAWIYTTDITKDNLSQIEDISGVSDVSRRLYLDGTHGDQTVSVFYIENTADCNFLVTSGAAFDMHTDGMWLFDEYAKQNSISVGDTFDVESNGLTISKKVVGLVKGSEYLYFPKSEDSSTPDYQNTAYTFISSNFFDFTPEIPYNQILVHSSNDKKMLYEELDKVFRDQHYQLLTRDEMVSFASIQNKIDSTKVIANVFALAILLIAVLTMITTMNRINNKERVQIGILKALGFSNRKILMHYMSMGIIISILGSITGFLCGPPVIGDIYLKTTYNYYDYPLLATKIRDWDYLIVLLLNLALVIVLYLTCKKILRVKASDANSNRFKSKNVKDKTVSNKQHKMHSFNTLWTVRDITRNIIRSLMTILGVMGSLALISCGFTMKDTMASLNSWTFDELHHYNSRITLNSNIADTQAIKASVDGESSQTIVIELIRPDEYNTANLIAYDVDKLVEFEDEQGASVSFENDSLYISKKSSDKYGLKVGDTIKWRVYGANKEYTAKIFEIVNSPIEQGIFVTKEYLENLSIDYTPTTIYTSAKEGKIERNDNMKSVVGVDELQQQNDKALESFTLIIDVIIIAAIAMGIVVLYNLGILSYTEMFWELPTLKVLGFSDKALNLLNFTQTMLLSLIGIVFGIPLGRLFATYMFNSIEVFPFKMYTSIASFCLSIGGVLAVILLVSVVHSKKIKEIDMVVSLKANE